MLVKLDVAIIHRLILFAVIDTEWSAHEVGAGAIEAPGLALPVDEERAYRLIGGWLSGPPGSIRHRQSLRVTAATKR